MRRSRVRRAQSPQKIGVLSHAVAVSSDVDEMAVVQDSVDESCGHDLIAENLSPLLEALVGGQHRRVVLVAPADELEEEHGSVAADGQVADLIDLCEAPHKSIHVESFVMWS